MIQGRDIFLELKIDSCFSNNIIRVNGGTYKGYVAPIKYFSKINLNTSSNWNKIKIFHNEEIWESRHILDAKLCMRCILDANYKNMTYVMSLQKENIQQKRSKKLSIIY